MASIMEMTSPTMRKYVDLLEQTFILRTLPPYEMNVKKRLVKSHKVYVRDSGILHLLLGIKNSEMLFGHPVFGASWEGLVIEQLLSAINVPAYFYRTAKGEEIDLVLEINGSVIAIECKASSAPQPTKGFYKAIGDLQPIKTFIVAPISTPSYLIAQNTMVVSLRELIEILNKMQKD
jgi:predicted AAA+ superfamily ATPase